MTEGGEALPPFLGGIVAATDETSLNPKNEGLKIKVGIFLISSSGMQLASYPRVRV